MNSGVRRQNEWLSLNCILLKFKMNLYFKFLIIFVFLIDESISLKK